MKILVISGTGFISSCTCDRLLSLADEVIVLDTLTPRVHPNGWPVPRAAYLSFGDEFYHGDTSNRDLMTNLLNRSDAVYHLGILFPVERQSAVRRGLNDTRELLVQLNPLGSHAVLNVLRDIWG
jgi:nucleoside-diphosphate-sugar epimerase